MGLEFLNWLTVGVGLLGKIPAEIGMTAKVLVVDADVRLRRALAAELKELGYSTVEAGDGEEGWNLFCQQDPAVVITDLAMPRCDGQELLRRIRVRSDVPVIFFTAQGSVDAAVAALKAGADDFVAAKENGAARLVGRVASALEGRQDSPAGSPLGDRIAGTSLAIQRCRSRMMALAPLRVPVLFFGEEGVGRSAAVEALNELSSGGRARLATLQCEGWKPGLGFPRVEAIHLKGVEKLSASAGAFLVDRIQESERGGFIEGPRIIASAHPLFGSSKTGAPGVELRQLLGRLSIEVPALRQRPGDIPDIASVLVNRLGRTLGRRVTLSASALAFLVARPWPGNIAQLEGFLERAVAFSREGLIRQGLLAEIADEEDEGIPSLRRHRQAQEHALLLQVLRETGGNVSRTAERMLRSRSAVYRLIEKHGISLATNR
jgi:two-component system response regulator AtoC